MFHKCVYSILTSVHTQVFLECVLLCETLCTHFTYIWFLPTVFPLMCSPRLSVKERFTAIGTGEGTLPGVTSHVKLELESKYTTKVIEINTNNSTFLSIYYSLCHTNIPFFCHHIQTNNTVISNSNSCYVH